MKTLLFNYIENFTTKEGNFQIKNSAIYHISAHNIDCEKLEQPQQGGSNEYPQSMVFFSKMRKIMYTPVNHFFTV